MGSLPHVDRATIVLHHVTANLYPPAPAAVVPYALEALDAIEAGEPDRAINGPAGSMTAAALVDSLNLWDMVRERTALRVIDS